MASSYPCLQIVSSEHSSQMLATLTAVRRQPSATGFRLSCKSTHTFLHGVIQTSTDKPRQLNTPSVFLNTTKKKFALSAGISKTWCTVLLLPKGSDKELAKPEISTAGTSQSALPTRPCSEPTTKTSPHDKPLVVLSRQLYTKRQTCKGVRAGIK